MKKMFLFAAFAGIALASCTTDEEIFAPVNQGNEIEFVAADYVHQTRANEHDLSLQFSNEDFSVWAWLTGKDAAHISALQVNANGTYTGAYYWPDEALDFAAVSPANDPRIDVDRSNGATTITYTFDTNHGNDGKINLMHADTIKNKKQGNGTVALGFRHALAKLNVVVNQNHVAKNDDPAKKGNEADIKDYQVIVNSLSIENFNCYGTYKVTSNAQNIANDNVWTDTSGDADWTIIDNTPTSLVEDIVDFADKNYESTYVYVMPQLIPAGAKVIIDYDVVTVFKSGATSTTSRTKTVNLNEIKNGSGNAITHWYTNKVITYTFTINPQYDLTPITFSATEEEWGTQGGTHTF